MAFVSDRDGTNIYLSYEDGSEVTLLTAGDWPAWSRDRRRLAFQRSGGLYVINVDGTGQRRIATGSAPSWSPDGAKIAFHNGGGAEILTINADGSGASLLVSRALVWPGSNDYGAITPAWSPDGQTIAFVRASWEDVSEIYLINVDGSGFRRLINTDQLGRYSQRDPAWSPDGTAIAFSYANGIGVAHADGSGWRLGMPSGLPTFNPGLLAFNPEWTPDGRLIFDKSIASDGRSRLRIFVADAGAGRQLIPDATAPVLTSYSDRGAVWAR